MTSLIEQLMSTDETLAIHFTGDGPPLEVTWMWVRDHSEDPESFDAATRQRNVDTFALPSDQRPGKASIVDGSVVVRWPDDAPDAILPASLLAEVAGRSSTADRTLWSSAAEVCDITAWDYDEVSQSAEGRRGWLGDIANYGMGMLTGAPTDQSVVDSVANRIGYVRHSVFGGPWTLSSEVVAHADSAYGAETLEPHTDGSYSHDGPGMQLFACSERTGTGGESVLVDGFAAAEALRSIDPDAFALLCEVPVPGQYLDDGVHLRTERPTIRLDTGGEILQVTFNNYDRAPFALEPTKMRRWYDAYAAFHALISDRSRWWMHRLEPGEVLIFDNWRCLHGRMAYTGKRIFHGGYLNHEDLESALRSSLVG